MEAAVIIGRVVQREAEKLDKLSEAKAEPLDASHYEQLEVLALTIKALRNPNPIGRPPSEAADPEADLELLKT